MVPKYLGFAKTVEVHITQADFLMRIEPVARD
jgi:hypothetical protein